MGLISSIIKGVGRAVQTIRDLPGKINRWDLSKDIRRNTKPVETTEIPVVDDSWRRHKKRRVPAVNPPAPPKPEVQPVTPDVARMQRKLELAVQAAITGKVGNANASKDADKLDKQLEYALSVEAAEEKAKETGEEEPPVVIYDSPDEAYRDVEDLTDVEQAELQNNSNPWFSPQ